LSLNAAFFPAGRTGSPLQAREARRHGDAIRLMISPKTIDSDTGEPGLQSCPPLFRYRFPDRGDFPACVSGFRACRPMRRLARHPGIFPCSMSQPLPRTPAWPGATTCHSGASATAPW